MSAAIARQAMKLAESPGPRFNLPISRSETAFSKYHDNILKN
jgi:hypothetical protein